MIEASLATSSEVARQKDIESIARQVTTAVERLENCANRIDEFLDRVSGGGEVQQLKGQESPCRPGSLGGIEAQLYVASAHLDRLQASITQLEDIG